MIFKTEDLLASIKVRALIPTSQQTFQDSDLINLMNEEMQISLVPDIQSVRENYFLRPMTVPVIAGQKEYTIPERAIGGAVYNVFFKDTAGNRIRMIERKVSDLQFETVVNGNASGFYLIGDKIRLNTVPSSGSLEFFYYCRPSDLVKTTSCSKVTGVTKGATQTVIDLDTDLSATISTSSLVDIISAKSPNQIQGFDCTVGAIGASSITINNSFVTDDSGALTVVVGDYICPAQKSNIPLIPSELHSILAQMCAARVVEALGDMTKVQMVGAKLADMKKQAFTLIANRVESGATKITSSRGIRSHIGGNW